MATSTTAAEAPRARLGLTSTDLTMLVVVLLWGVNFSVAKLAMTEFSPVVFAALRFAAGALVLGAIVRWLEGPIKLTGAQLWKLTWVGIIGNTAYQVLFMTGLTITSAANGALLIATTPAMVAVAGALLGIERLRRGIVIGIGLALVGVALVLASRGLTFSAESVAGDLLMLGAAVAWTIYTLGVRTMSGDLSPLRITSWTMITGVPGLVLLSLPELGGVSWAAISGGAWAGLAYSTLLALVLAYVLWNNSVRVAGSNRTAIYGCAIPLVAALAAWPLLGEVPTPLQGLGAAFIIAGVLMTRR